MPDTGTDRDPMSATEEKGESITIRIDASTKREWKDHVEGTGAEYVSLTQLIMVAVENELSEDDDVDVIPTLDVENLDFSEVEDKIEELTEEVASVDDRMETVEGKLSKDDLMDDAMSRAMRYIPTVSDASEVIMDEYDEMDAETRMECGEEKAVANMVRIATGIEKADVELAMRKLADDVGSVQMTQTTYPDIGTVTHYYKLD